LLTDLLGLIRIPKLGYIVSFDIAEFLHKETDIDITYGVDIDRLLRNIAAFRLNKMIRVLKIRLKRL
jgi:hypothetical protein